MDTVIETMLEDVFVRGEDQLREMEAKKAAERSQEIVFEVMSHQRAVEMMGVNLDPILLEYLSFHRRNNPVGMEKWEAEFDIRIPNCALVRIYGNMEGRYSRVAILNWYMEVDKETNEYYCGERQIETYSYDEIKNGNCEFIIANARRIGDNRARVEAEIARREAESKIPPKPSAQEQAEIDLERASRLLEAAIVNVVLGHPDESKVEAMVAIGMACVQISKSLLRIEGVIK